MSRPIDRLPVNLYLEIILDKILDNFSSPGDFRKLTSFSESRERALRHAAFRGWLLEVEVAADGRLDAEPYLERSRCAVPVGSREWERIGEAEAMAKEDQEVFLLPDVPFRVVRVGMVGGFEIRSLDQ